MSEDVLEWYEELSSVYDELYGDEQRSKYAIINEVLTEMNIRLKDVVVDVGCGSGGLINDALISDVLYYVGLDLSPKLLSKAREKLENLSLVGDVVAGDMFIMPFRSNSIKTLISVTAIVCGTELKVYEEVKRVLSLDGVALLTVLCTSKDNVMIDKLGCYVTYEVSSREVLCLNLKR
ncbi:MAG: hypothetical protein B7O98_05450 [Zestosphaera tikiterensis]|uniref:Methyltransferase domain-containing protein n=1 Tax=Zestosphaera tikiterensis TaxID=1973259 RepID=A0A2R7Y3S3_9CREN|nr:MAG: hypothetical protein B7O98_05450 [Zestosphaera tikiterensis]